MADDSRGNPWVYKIIGGIMALVIIGLLIPLLIAGFGVLVLIFLVMIIAGRN